MDAIRRDPSWSEKAAGALQFVKSRWTGHPTLINLEVTRACNARCDFCRYWRTPSEKPLDDYVPVIRRLKPSVVIFTGGEPLLRRDLARLIGDVRREFPAIYLGMVTNGALLSVGKGLELWDAGLNQITVSLDFPDERHDGTRGIPGLTKRILRNIPQLIAAGIDNLVIQTVVKTENLACVADVIEWARSVGARV
ncbi:MAG TPA: radical SAM protein [Acidobacteriota bacterium]|nr:radical SAM protein [Acidobacteriota bacterium]